VSLALFINEWLVVKFWLSAVPKYQIQLWTLSEPIWGLIYCERIFICSDCPDWARRSFRQHSP